MLVKIIQNSTLKSVLVNVNVNLRVIGNELQPIVTQVRLVKWFNEVYTKVNTQPPSELSFLSLNTNRPQFAINQVGAWCK